MELKTETFVESVCSVIKQFQDFNKKVDLMINEVDELKVENEKIEYENKCLSSEMLALKMNINNIERSNLINSVNIIGIPYAKNEDCYEIVKEIGLKTDTNIKVIKANRIYFAKSRTSVIEAKLGTAEMRRNLIRNTRLSQLSANTINSVFPKEIKVFVNEKLAEDQRILFRQARITGKDKQFKFVWVNNGEILMRKDENAKVINIRSQQDLDKV